MKKLGFANKIIFVFNSLVAFVLLISYVSPYVEPKRFATLSVLSLGVPLLILLNVLFFIYWLLRAKKQLLLSLIVLVLGWSSINSMYKFSSSQELEDANNLSVMSYNVRLFNMLKWSPSPTIREDIVEFLFSESADIICLQEYQRGKPITLEGYYSFNATYVRDAKGGLAIFSKFPIINSGSLEFPNTFNNAIFVDIVKQKDTIRVYNLHLQSSGINADIDHLKKESSEHLFRKVGATFKEQQEQVRLFLQHKSKCQYNTIVTGDFNNTAYSYTYKEVIGDMLDTFKEAGHGFGRTYDFKFFPLRIDFILVDDVFTVNGYKSYDIKLSDHYPINATLKLH